MIDVPGADAGEAVAAAWEGSGLAMPWPVKLSAEQAPYDGWDLIHIFDYDVPKNERRFVTAAAHRAAGQWTVVLLSMDRAVLEKRGGEIATIGDQFLPKGYERENFADRRPHRLDQARLDQLRAFVRESQAALQIPGISIGIVQDGEVVMAEGFGVRQLGKDAPVDADTLYLVASTTKAMTTLMLGRLVDAGKLQWQDPVLGLMPGFALGDAATTARVRVEHLVCACTGLPRQDYEWLMEFRDASADSTLASLAKMQPTSGFGELYQYSNPLASAGGYVGGHVYSPGVEKGAAYDRAMQELVFNPLGMTRTTFDFSQAQAGNHARPHALDIDAVNVVTGMDVNYAIRPMRPAGGAWSSVNDMLRYVQLELDRGLLPDGSRLVSEAVIDERRKAKVAIGNEGAYGMGLIVDRRWGLEAVGHGGSLFGYKSNMVWLPEHGVGAVILANSDQASPLLGPFQRRLIELLFDGVPEAAAEVEAAARTEQEYLASQRAGVERPAGQEAAAALANRYHHPALGELAVRREPDGRLVFDFGEWSSEVGSRVESDGAQTYVMLRPFFMGRAFVVVEKVDGKATRLAFRTNQQEYIFQAR
ncbi:serine hydrolase domain-containing protein [Arenimonas soli]|uniref:serine hydrolase domain-containing protein n=1 Tax=Arenimonas soli TaxID=2269504 RepID=UPI00166F06FA|nr:serine hydrolase domain-containing protein [Arenimonas soli]